jgi:2-polyprenyl-3-methyl-5-hydroxy-6-metoxy-1,4-benzoquinol methylase
MINKSEKFWDFVANKYDKTEKHLEPIFLKIHNNIKRHLNKSDILLDYGCGTGTISIEIANHVKEIRAIDISTKMLDIAKRKASEHNIENVDFIQTTIFDERFTKDSFDVILAIGLLHLLKDNKQNIKRIADLLKPGGLFISSTPCLAEKMTFLTKLQFYPVFLLIKLGLIPGYMKRFKISELNSLVSSGNLQIIETEKIFHTLTAYYIVTKKN